MGLVLFRAFGGGGVSAAAEGAQEGSAELTERTAVPPHGYEWKKEYEVNHLDAS